VVGVQSESVGPARRLSYAHTKSGGISQNRYDSLIGARIGFDFWLSPSVLTYPC
jgi:hypothetical protein